MTFPNDTTENVDQGQELPVEETGTVEENKPPYASYLEGLPTSIVPMVEKAFKQWDADTSRKFQEVHSQYEPLKPYKNLAEIGRAHV